MTISWIRDLILIILLITILVNVPKSSYGLNNKNFTDSCILSHIKDNLMRFVYSENTNWVTFLCFSDRASYYRLVSCYQLNAYILYSITIYMIHYNPQHVSSSTLLIFRRTNCIFTASGIVTLCKRLYSMSLSTGILYGRLQRVTIPLEAVII